MQSTYQETEKKLKLKAEALAAKFVGKTIASVVISVGYPGYYSEVQLRMNDGSCLNVSPKTSGCSECDPCGLGTGLHIDL